MGRLTLLTRPVATALGVDDEATMDTVKVGDGSDGIMRPDTDARLSLIRIPSLPMPVRLALGVAPHVDSLATVDHPSALSPDEEMAGEAEID